MRAAFGNDRSTGFFVSVALHAVIFLVGALTLVKPIEYAVETGDGGIEVSLTAAPAEIAEPQETIAEKIPEKKIDIAPTHSPEAILIPEPVEEKKETAPVKPVEKKAAIANTAVSAYKGDGSSAIPGKDATTFYSSAGAVSEAKPNYLKNAAPVYPWEAREKGWEGVVVFKVLVDKFGKPVQIEKESSSGYTILDDSALKTLKKWKFKPARVGNIPVESQVRVPIRFELEKK